MGGGQDKWGHETSHKADPHDTRGVTQTDAGRRHRRSISRCGRPRLLREAPPSVEMWCDVQ